MGSFFTNVQVRTDEAGRARVLEALRAALAADGMEAVDDGEDRTIVVRGVDPGGWVAIYDSRTESQDQDALDELASLASRATGGHAFWSLIHDSDVLALGLFEAGELRDRYDSFPDYFEPIADEAKAALRGDPAAWAPLAAPGVADGDLATLLGHDDLRAEPKLAQLARALGVEPARALVGVRYLAPEDRDAEENVVLRYRARARPAWEREAEGPPRFALGPSAEVPVALAVGDPLRLAVSTINEGGATEGLRVAAWGSALDEDLVALDEIELVLGDARAGGARSSAPVADARTPEGGRMRVAEVPDAPVPAGPAQAAFPPGGDVGRWMQAQQRARVHANAIGRVLRDGEGELYLGLVALADVEAQVSLRYRVRIDPPFWAPLRVAAPHPLAPASMQLRPLSTERARVVLAVLPEGMREREGAEVLAAFARSAGALSFGGIAVNVFHGDPTRRPTTTDHRDWPADLEAELRTSRVLSVEVRRSARPPDPEEQYQRSAEGLPPLVAEAGLILGTAMIAPHRGRPEALVAAAWLPLDAPPEVTAPIEELLADLADRGALAQATWSVAGWVPYLDPTTTDYERACGIHHVGADRAFVERWLRWPGRERVFLGASLLANLDESTLGSVGRVTRGAHGLWLERDPHVDRDAWERALAPVLPSAEDARALTRG